MTAARDLDGMFRGIQRSVDLRQVLPGDVRVSIVLSGEGGGAWTFDTTTDTFVRRGEVTPVDCRVACTVSDFLSLISGNLSPRRGFMDGRIEVEGDVGLILRLQRAIVRLNDVQETA
jgi:putative sterol carrier protein